MKYEVFHHKNKQVRSIPVYLGTASFGTSTDKKDAFRVLDAYYELGGRHIDTANNYAFWTPEGKGGESETLIGEWLESRKCRDEVVITTKVGALPVSGGASLEGLSRAVIQQELLGSLKRLKTSYVDVYLAHADDRRTPFDETLETFAELVDKEKILSYGASNYNLERFVESHDAARARSLPWFSVLQQRYSLLHPLEEAEFGVQEMLRPSMLDDLGILFPDLAITAYSPLLDGAFLGVDSDSTRRYRSPMNQGLADALASEAKERGCHVHALVLRKIYEKGPIPITMTSSVEHLKENVALLLPE